MSQTGVYSDQQILAAIEAKQIIFHPFNDDQISGSSVDVTLGSNYYRTGNDQLGQFYNPFSHEAVKKYFAKPLTAVRHDVWTQKNNRPLFENIPSDHPIIILRPGERILTHTHEFIGILPPGTATMQARSTWGRNGVAVCLDAGWGDPGYINRWTMEVYNLNQKHSVVLPVGERIAQIVFHHTGPVKKSYNQSSNKYQSSTDLQTLINNWQPETMLPKAYSDKRRQPADLNQSMQND